MSDLVSVQLEALGALLAELTVLGRHLEGEAQLSVSTGRSLGAALRGAAGAAAEDVGADWSAAVTALAARTLAVAGTLDSALTAYRAADAALAARIGAERDAGGSRGRVVVAR